MTAAHDRDTIWVVLDRSADAVRYARITPGHLAGTVEVRLRDGVAHVTYDLTALTREAQPELEHFAAGYDAFLAEWESAIGALDAG